MPVAVECEPVEIDGLVAGLAAAGPALKDGLQDQHRLLGLALRGIGTDSFVRWAFNHYLAIAPPPDELPTEFTGILVPHRDALANVA